MLRFFRRRSHTRAVIELWNSPKSAALDYYQKAESPEWIDYFWREGSPFRIGFDRLDLTAVLDLACGQGRHAARFVDRAGHLTLFDTSPVAIDACRARFAGRTNVLYVVSETGRTLDPIESESLTAVVSYDAMVHFEASCVFEYLREIQRVVRPGGMALLHVSAYDAHPERDFRANPDWRAHMSLLAFEAAAQNSGLRIETLERLRWSGQEATDALALLVRP